MRWFDYITLNTFWLGLNSISQSVTPLVLPLLVQQFVGDENKGTYFGLVRFCSLMLAMVAQPLIGMISDRTATRWGKRRPFIVGGTLVAIFCLTLVGLTSTLAGMGAYWLLFGLVLFLMIGTNAVQAGGQALMPDLIPAEHRGLFSGIKAIFEIPLSLVLFSLTAARLIAAGNIIGGLVVTQSILVLSMLPVLFAPEPPSKPVVSFMDRRPFLHLLEMAGLFIGVILAGRLVVDAVGVFIASFSGNIRPWIIGVIGLAAMAACAGFGALAGVRLGLGAEARRAAPFTWWVVNRLLFLIGVNNIGTFAVYFLQGKFGNDRQAITGPAMTLIVLVGLAIFLSALPSGWLTDRIGHRRVITACGLISAAGAVLAIFSPNFPGIYVGGVIIGIGVGPFLSANWALGTSLVPSDQVGRYLGIANIAGAGAGAIGAFLGGPLADVINRFQPGAGYPVLYLIFAMMFLISILALQGVYRPTAG